MNWIMEPYMLDSGQKKDFDTDKDSKYGRMVLSMRVTGRMTWLTEKEG